MTENVKTDVFSLGDGEWRIRIGDDCPLTTWNSRGAALAGLAVELRRRNRAERHSSEAPK